MRQLFATPLHDWPLPELRRRSARARRVLRGARAAVGRPGALQHVDAALDEVELLLPGLTAPGPTLIDRAMRDLGPEARAALRHALDTAGDARRRLACMLGGVPEADADQALSRVEEQDAVLGELLGLLSEFERTYCSPWRGRNAGE